MGKLKRVDLEQYSKAFPPKPGRIEGLKKKNYNVIELFVSGDAPKEVIKLYEYKKGQKSNPKNWPIYIAKTGHKWYPYESITEYLLNRLGECFDLKMAPCKLVEAGGQIRFMSKYFLGKNQRLIHGAEIFSGYLEDKDFVEEIENKNMARDMLSVQFVKESLSMFFPEEVNQLFREFIKLLLFDAVVGNNDRHFYNWGIIVDIFKKNKPLFSPIYDTARGLFWNESEDKLRKLYNNKEKKEIFLKKYINNCKPKIGWDGKQNQNHFQLVSLIKENELGLTKNEINNFLSKENESKCLSLVSDVCSGLFRKERESLIIDCLSLRFNVLRKK